MVLNAIKRKKEEILEQDQIVRITEDLLFLTSKEAGGRIPGSEGARIVANYLANELRKYDYKPIGKDGYFSPVEVPLTQLKGPVQLTIGNKRFKHRIDFGEIVRYGDPNGGSYEGELKVIRDGEQVEPEELKGKIVLIPERPANFDLASTVQAAEQYGIGALLVEYGEPKWFPKNIHVTPKRSIPVLRIRSSIAKEIEHRNGEWVKIDLPIVSGKVQCQNVTGILHHSHSRNTLLLTAHYDHLGDDPDGWRFPGAVDNGSGVAVILETAREWAKKANQLPFNLMVAFLTGEETGLHGAKVLSSNPPLPIHGVINLDSVGFDPDLNAMRIGHDKPGLWLADIAAEIIKKNGVEVRWIKGGEDSIAFQAAGFPAIGLGQKPTDPTQRTIHTPDDNYENIYMKPLSQAYRIVHDIINYLATHPRHSEG